MFLALLDFDLVWNEEVEAEEDEEEVLFLDFCLRFNSVFSLVRDDSFNACLISTASIELGLFNSDFEIKTVLY